MSYMRLRGSVSLAKIVNGIMAEGYTYVGNTSDAKLQLSTDEYNHFETETGNDMIDLTVAGNKTGKFDLTLEKFLSDNLAMVLYGTVLAQDTSAVSGEKTPTGVKAGQRIYTRKPYISNVVVKDSGGKTLVASTNYVVGDADQGRLEFTNLTTGGPFTQPFLIDYTPSKASTSVNMFTNVGQEYAVLFEGVNAISAQATQKVRVELYRWKPSPIQDFDLKAKELLRLPISGGLLDDPTKASDAVLGRYGRVVLL